MRVQPSRSHLTSPVGSERPPFPLVWGVLFLAVGVLCLWHVFRNYAPGDLSEEGMDTVQAARYLARTGRFGTQVVRPLLANDAEPFPDGALPDLGHAPLFRLPAAAAIRLLRHTSIGQGDRETVMLSALFHALGIGLAGLLAYRLFRPARSGLSAWLVPTALMFASFGTDGWRRSLNPTAISLASVLFTLLLLALFTLDSPSSDESAETGAGRRAGPGGVLLAGFLFGLLFLSLYSALLLLPPILFYVWRVGGRELRAPLLFLAAAAVMAAPLLYRNWSLTGFPLYHSGLYELVANTDTYGGAGVFRSAALPMPIPQFLANGGFGQLARKAAGNLSGTVSLLPGTLGVGLFPLFLGGFLIRFPDARVGRLRWLVGGCLAAHLAGLAFFHPPERIAPVLLVYGPFIAALASGFLVSVSVARNRPLMLGRVTILGWVAIVCLPGLWSFVVWPFRPNRATVNSNLYYYLNTVSPEMETIRTRRIGLLVSDAPWDLAFRCDVPTVWLPNDTGAFQAVEERFGKPIVGVALTSKLRRDYAEDAEAEPYVTTYDRLVSLTTVAAKVDADLRERLIGRARVFYPARIAGAMRGFQPMPLPEDDGSGYSMLFLSRRVFPGVK
ncbi:MAG: hypothetical protein SFU56_16980 [Capsulimonadales bacterium]|nr:hypothetical protein [Capsulimonadales bacterium]